jgi:hypothetical protein
MPDWKEEISRRLASLKLTPAREAEIIKALATQRQSMVGHFRLSIPGTIHPKRTECSAGHGAG